MKTIVFFSNFQILIKISVLCQLFFQIFIFLHFVTFTKKNVLFSISRNVCIFLLIFFPFPKNFNIFTFLPPPPLLWRWPQNWSKRTIQSSKPNLTEIFLFKKNTGWLNPFTSPNKIKFDQKSKFWSKIEILVKNRTFAQTFFRNRKFDRRSEFCPKNRNFDKKVLWPNFTSNRPVHAGHGTRSRAGSSHFSDFYFLDFVR